MMTAPRTSAPQLSELLAGFATVAPRQERPVRGLALDSRQVRPGDVFCAMRGTRTHGNEFIAAAVRAGAAAVLVDDDTSATKLPADVPLIRVPGLKQCLGEIAGRYYGRPSEALRVVGVTGTNGKTSVAHLIAQALDRINGAGSCGLMGTLGYGLLGQMRPATTTTPDAIAVQALMADLRDRGARAAAMEVSSHALHQSRTAGVHFAAAVFTNLTRDHLDYHGEMEAYGAAKAELFQSPGLEAAVINADDAFGHTLLDSVPSGIPVYACTFAETPPALNPRQVRGRNVQVARTGVRLDVDCEQRHAHLNTHLLGRFNANNLLIAFAAVIALGVPWEQASAAFQNAAGVAGRMEPFQAGATPLVIVDYAHTPDGLEQVLRSAREFCAGRLWCVFGCGGNRDQGKRPLMGAIAARDADVVVLTSDNPRDEDPHRIIADIAKGIPAGSSVDTNPDRAAAVAGAIARADPADVVVVAGKGHEDYQEIHGQRIPLSDRALVLAALRTRGQ